MVRFNDEAFTRLTKTRKKQYLNRLKKEAEKNVDDIQFKLELIQKYKDKIQAELQKPELA